MEIEIDSRVKDLLDVLKRNQIKIWETQNRKDIADIWNKFDYNDLIMVLHLGFSEMAFYQSMVGVVEPERFDIPKENLNKIRQGLHRLIGGK